QGARRAALWHRRRTRGRRTAAVDDVVSGRRPLRLAADGAGEGLHLRRACRLVVNLELPWNPMRLEQRIGRVDRLGQRRRVHAVHLIARGTSEARVLDRLRGRVARARIDIGAADPLENDDEVAVARSVLAGDGGRPERETASDPAPTPDIRLISMKPEATTEATRLATVRQLSDRRAGRGILFADGRWLTFARAPATRQAVGSRLIVIMRATCEDGFGVALESSVIPVAVGWPSHRFNRRQLDEFLELIYPEIRARVEDAAVEWRERTVRLTGAFLDVRLAREHAIGSASDAIASTFQAGLFDRLDEA